MKIRHASLEDYDGIIFLLKAYHTNYILEEDRPDGFVTTNFTPEQLTALIEKECGVMVAEDESGRIVAYATAAPWSFWAQWPLFTCMIEKLPGYSLKGVRLTVENSYQYGPVCVEKSLRGTGVFEQIFRASLESMSGRYPFMATFINQINPRSYAAHVKKAGMTEVGTFQFNNNNYYLMACATRTEA